MITHKNQSQKLAVAQRSMERSILVSQKDKIGNVFIRETTKVKDIIQAEKDLKTKWAGHVARITDGPKLQLNGPQEGTCK